MSAIAQLLFKHTSALIFLAPIILFLQGCSGAAESANGTSRPNTAPKAIAAVDNNEVAKRATVTLDGSQSSDPEGDQLSYLWTQLSGTPITIDDPAAAMTTFSAPTRPDTIRFSLVVSDDHGLASKEAIVSVSVINHDPIADAGGNQRAAFNTTYTLDGQNSSDPDKDTLGFEWTYLGSSPSSIVDIPLSSRFTSTATFTVPSNLGEVLQFKLKVTDEDNAFSEQYFNVTVTSGTPIANAGPDQLGVTANSIIQLDGSLSYDPEQQPLTYIWTQIRGSTVSLDNPSSATPSFQTPVNPSNPFLEFQLQVSDGDTLSQPDTVAVSVLNYVGTNIEPKQNPFRHTIDWRNPVNPPNVTGIAVSGSHAFVSDSYYGLWVIDISDPSNLKQVGGYETPQWGASDIAVNGDYAFLAAGSSGIYVINISSPQNPTLVTTYSTGASANGIQIAGNYAYVANGAAGLLILDITNPASPSQAGVVDTPSNAYELQVVGTKAYIADSTSLQVADVSNVASPKIVDSFTTANTVANVYVDGSYAYLPVYQNGLEIVDISVSPLASAGNYTAYTGQYIIDYAEIAISNGIGYLGNSGGLEVIDVSNLNSISRLASYSTSWWTRSLSLSNGNVYLGDNGGMRVVDVSPVTSTPGFEHYTTGIDLIYDLDSSANNVYIAHRSGLEIFNKSTKTLSHYNTTGAAAAVQAINDEVFVLNALPDMSLEIIDATQSPAKQTGLYDLPDASYGIGGTVPESLQIVNNTAYLADYFNGLTTVDITDRANPSYLANYAVSFYPYFLNVTADSLHIGSSRTLFNFDLSTPTAPNLSNSQSVKNTPWGAYFENNTGYLATGEYGIYENGGLEIVTLNTQNQLVTTGKLETPGWAYDIAKNGNSVYIADGHAQRTGSWSGLRVIDTTYPAVPTLMSSYSTSYFTTAGLFDLRGVTLSNTTAYVGSYTLGMFVIPDTVLNMTKNYQSTDVLPGNSISYNINWNDYGTHVDVICKVSSGTCNVTNVDLANSSATVNWTLPNSTGGNNHKIIMSVGNWHFFVSAQDLINL